MFGSFKVALRRGAVRSRLADLSYGMAERRLRDESGPEIDRLTRRGVTSGWSARTTAAVVAAMRSAGSAMALDPDRRARIGRILTEQDASGATALGWLAEFSNGHMNPVGIDPFVLRYNYANGMLAAWIDRGRDVDPQVRPIFIALSAWALAGVPGDAIDSRREELLANLENGRGRVY